MSPFYVLLSFAAWFGERWLLVSSVRLAVIAVPLLCAIVCCQRFSAHRLVYGTGLAVSILLELQHLTLYLRYIASFDPNTASHIGAAFYWFLALIETLLIFGVLFYAVRHLDK